jgi:hypothetical protein
MEATGVICEALERKSDSQQFFILKIVKPQQSFTWYRTGWEEAKSTCLVGRKKIL